MTDELSFDKAFASKSTKHQEISDALAETKPKKSNHKADKSEKSSKKRRRHTSDDDESDDDQDMDDEEEQRRKRKAKAKKEKEKEKEKEKAKSKNKNNDSDDDEESSKSKKRRKEKQEKGDKKQDNDSSIRDKWKETEEQDQQSETKEPDQATLDLQAKLAAEATAKFMPKAGGATDTPPVAAATKASASNANTNGTHASSDSAPSRDTKSSNATTTAAPPTVSVTEALAIAKAAAASAELAEAKAKQQQQQGKIDPATDQASAVGKELVVAGTKGKEIINAPLWVNPNKWLGDNPNYFRNIKLNDIGFTVYITEDGPNIGKPAMRIFRRGNPRFDLEVVSPFGKVVRSHFGKDGNFRDPKSQVYIIDKKIPIDAKQTICYICAAYTDYNKDENGLDIDMRDYFIWLLTLGAAFYKAVCEYDQLQTGIKDKIKRLLKTDDPAVIYNGMYENYNPPVYEVVEPPTSGTVVAGATTVGKPVAVATPGVAGAATGEKKKAPRKIVDPKELTCKIPTCFVWKKGSVFTRFTAGKKNRKKPAKGVVISCNPYLDMMHDYGYLYNYIPLFEQFSKTPVPFEKAELRGGDLCSDGSKIRPYMNGKNPETNDTVFGMGQSLQYVRIWERGGFVTAEQKAIMYIPADAPIPGEHDGIVWEDTVCETFQVPQDSSAIAKAIEESKALVRPTN